MPRWLQSIILMLALLAQPAWAQTFPALTGPVVDQADIIPADREAALTAKLTGLQSETGRQVVVATLADLQGYDISDYGYRLGRAWGIGEKGKNNGLVIIVAPKERRMRIEVGYGLEPIVTDGLSSRIINDQMKPLFRANDYAGGIDRAVDTLATQLKLPPDEAAARARDLASQNQAGGNDSVDLGTILFWLFVFLFVILPIMRSMFGKRGQRYGGGPVIIWGGGGSSWGGGSSGSSWGDGGGYSGGGGSFGGGGSSGSW